MDKITTPEIAQKMRQYGIQKIDRRKRYYLTLDVETANDTTDALVYDVGFCVHDKHGVIYRRFSFLIYDIFIKERGLMGSCYYAAKLPRYYKGLRDKEFKVAKFSTVKFLIRDLIAIYNIRICWAYNAAFDRNALNTTERWLTKSRYRYFLPYGIEMKCIWHCAVQTIFNRPSFFQWATEHGKISPSGNLRTSAETAYSYMINDPDYQEEHTGAADVDIEVQILQYCIRQHKKMDPNINRWAWRVPQKAFKEWQAKQQEKEGAA